MCVSLFTKKKKNKRDEQIIYNNIKETLEM